MWGEVSVTHKFEAHEILWAHEWWKVVSENCEKIISFLFFNFLLLYKKCSWYIVSYFIKKDLLSFLPKTRFYEFFLDKLSTLRHSPFCFFVMRKVSPLRFKKRLCLVFILYNTPCFVTKKSVLSVFNPLMLTNYKYHPTLWRIERLV